MRTKTHNIGDIGILQWNTGGLSKRREDELFDAMRENDCHIAAVQEVKWNDVHKPAPHFDGYEVFYRQHSYKSRKNQHGGAAFIVRNDIVVSQDFTFSSDLCVVVIRVHLEDDTTLTLANAYVPPQEYSLILKLKHLVARLPKYAVLCGDFNAHNRMWNSVTPQNTAGRHLARVLDDHPDKLVLLNPSEVPTHITSRKSRDGIRVSKTVIDLAFCTPQAWEYTTWTMLPDSVLSYAQHRPIRLGVSLKALTREAKNFTPRYKVKGADPEAFRCAAEAAFKPLQAILKELTFNEKVRVIQKTFSAVGAEVLGLTSPPSPLRKPGWDASLTQLSVVEIKPGDIARRNLRAKLEDGEKNKLPKTLRKSRRKKRT